MPLPTDPLLGSSTLNVGLIRGRRRAQRARARGERADPHPDRRSRPTGSRPPIRALAAPGVSRSTFPVELPSHKSGAAPAGWDTTVVSYASDLPFLATWGECYQLGPGIDPGARTPPTSTSARPTCSAASSCTSGWPPTSSRARRHDSEDPGQRARGHRHGRPEVRPPARGPSLVRGRGGGGVVRERGEALWRRRSAGARQVPLPERIAGAHGAGVRAAAARARSCSARSTPRSRGRSSRRSRRAGAYVVTNTRNHRMDADVPLLIPEANLDHLDLVDRQREARGWPGRHPRQSQLLDRGPRARAGAAASRVRDREAVRLHDAGGLGRRLPGRAVARHPRQRGAVHRRRGGEDRAREPEDPRHARPPTASTPADVRGQRAYQPGRHGRRAPGDGVGGLHGGGSRRTKRSAVLREFRASPRVACLPSSPDAAGRGGHAQPIGRSRGSTSSAGGAWR